MAEPRDKNQGSLFKSAIIAAPIAIGGGIGISRLSKSSSHFSAPINPIPNNPANEAIRSFTNRYASPQRSGAYKDWQLEKLSGLSNDIVLTAEQTRDSIMRAARIADPSGNVATTFSARLSKATTGGAVLQDLHKVLSETNSIYAQRAASIFLEDIDVLNTRVNAGLPIDTKTVFQKVSRRKRRFNLKPESVLNERMQKDAFKMAEMLGATLKVNEFSRTDHLGRELQLVFSGIEGFGEKEKLTLNIPRILSDKYPEVITRGTTQQSRYIAGMYGLVEGGVLKESFNHEEFTLRRAVEELIPQITRGKVIEQRAAQSIINSFQQKMMEPVELVPTLPPGTHQGLREYIKERSQIMRLYTEGDEGLRPLNEFEYYRTMERGHLTTPQGTQIPIFPGHSPGQIVKGVVSMQDVRGAMSLVPEAVPYGRRPLQFLRVGSTPLAPELIRGDPITNQFGWAKAKVGIESPMVRAAYISTALGPQFANTGVTSEGQLLVSERLAGKRAVQKIRQFDVAATGLVDLADMIDSESGSAWSINKQAAAGTMLGYSPTGRPVTLNDEMTMLGATLFEDKNKGKFIRVTALQDIEDMNYAKVFGGAKGMAVQTSSEYIESLLRNRADVSWLNNNIAPEVDALITMDELKKNRGLHYNQMFTALYEFTNQNIQTGKTSSLLASNFANNPTKMIANMRRLALNEDKFSHEAMLFQIKGVARMANLDPQQMGRVFGAVPEVFGGMEALGALSAAERTEIGKGVATGATQLFFEDLGGPGAGNIATIEPRAFELMGSPHFGQLGAEIQKDVANRLVAARPERLLEQAELDEAIASIRSPGQRKGSISAQAILREMKADDLLPSMATTMKLEGIGDVYIPSADSMSQLTSYQTPTGYKTESTLALAYKNTIDAASKYDAKNLTKDKMQAQLKILEDELFKTRIGTVTDKGGLLRGRLPGSVALTAVQPTLKEKLGDRVVGITAPMAEKAFESMRSLGIYQDAEISAMQKSFEAGGTVAGVLGRHPYIGPYSSQAVQFKKIAGTEAVVMINERQLRAISFKGQKDAEALQSIALGAENLFKGNQQMVKQMERMGGEMLSSPLRLSPFVGAAGDVDGDVFSAMFAGPQLQKSLTSHIMDQDALDAYEEYSIRSQVLKAKATGDAVTIRQVMAGDALKLGITKGKRLGTLSTQLQKYRAGILANMTNLSAQESMDALGLLEWMEQTPISGKHIAPGKEMQTIQLLDDISAALNKQNAEGIANAANLVMTHAKASGQGALTEGLTVAMEDIESGAIITRTIRGLDIQKNAENIVNALQALEASNVGGQSAARMRDVLLNRAGKLSEVDKEAIFNQRALSMSPFGPFFSGTEQTGIFSGLSDGIAAVKSRASSFVKSLKLLAKPVGIGIAASVGLSHLLSKPTDSLGSLQTATPNLQSGTGGANLGYGEHPHERQMGQPTVQNLVQSQHSARIAQDDAGYRVSVRGASGSQLDMNSLNSQIRQAVGNNTRINSYVRDQRSSLTPQKVSSILQDE